MNIKQLLKKYRNQVKPSQQTETRVYMKVFGEMPATKSTINNLHMFNKPLVKYLSVLLLVLSVIAVPLGARFLNKPLLLQTSSIADVYIQPVSTDASHEIKDNLGAEAVKNREDTSTSQDQRVLEQKGDFTLECVDVRDIFNKVKSLISTTGGYVQSSGFNSSSDRAEATLKVRVPADKFNSVIAELSKLDVRITSEVVNTVDRQNTLTELTKVQADLQQKITELETKIAAEQNAGTKAQLQSQLSGLKYQKTQADQSVQTLTQETSFSTLAIRLTTSNIFNLGGSWGNIAKTAEYVVIFWTQAALFAIIPLSLLYALVRLIKRARARKQI